MKKIAPRIVVNQNIRFGKPVIEGTRVPVDVIVGKIAGGMTTEEVAKEYELKIEDVFAALLYAAQVVREENFLYV